MRRRLRSLVIGATLSLLSVAAATDATGADRKGIGDNGPTKLTEQTDTILADTIRDFQALGVKWLRLDFDWSDIEASKGKYRLGAYDRVMKALAAANIHVLGVIAYSPGWANGGKPSKFYPPSEPGDYARFAGELARRYRSMGVHAWEIWNEQNVAQFWGPAPDPQRYAALLRAAYQAIHDVDPHAVVVTGGLAQPRNSRSTIAALDFLEALYAAGARRSFDAVGDHPYSSPYMPSDASSSNNWQRMAETSRSLRSVMADGGDSEKQLWVTEYGAPTGGISPYSQKIVISEDQQARMVDDAYASITAYSWAGPLFWYEYQDLCPPAGTESSECYYGLKRFDGSRKPAYSAYRLAQDR